MSDGFQSESLPVSPIVSSHFSSDPIMLITPLGNAHPLSQPPITHANHRLSVTLSVPVISPICTDDPLYPVYLVSHTLRRITHELSRNPDWVVPTRIGKTLNPNRAGTFGVVAASWCGYDTGG